MKRCIGLTMLCCMLVLAGCNKTIKDIAPTDVPVSTATAIPTLTVAPEVTVPPVLTEKPTVTEALIPTEMPGETAPSTVTPIPTIVPEPMNTPIPIVTPTLENRKIIAIDPGHQAKGNYEKEPVGPGATEMKAKVSSGTQGVSTKVPEYVFTLDISLKLRDVLAELGYEVVLTRETAEINISNVERAEIANEAEADIYIRIHADGSDNETANGISVLYPSGNNPYVAELSEDSKRLAQAVLDEMCKATGAKKRGIIKRDDLSGTNWAQMPVILIEAGFMTNKAEDEKLQDPEYQEKLVQGIVKGIEEYFGE